jgi:hypothetical protein
MEEGLVSLLGVLGTFLANCANGAVSWVRAWELCGAARGRVSRAEGSARSRSDVMALP